MLNDEIVRDQRHIRKYHLRNVYVSDECCCNTRMQNDLTSFLELSISFLCCSCPFLMLPDLNVRRSYFSSNSGSLISRWSDLKAELLAVDVSRDYCLERGEVECNICRATTVDELHQQGRNMVRMGSCGCVPIYCRNHLENWLKFSGGKCPSHLHVHGEFQNGEFPYHNNYISDVAARIILNGYFAVQEEMPRFGWETVTVRQVSFARAFVLIAASNHIFSYHSPL